jgi:regulator of sigma D
MSIEIPGLSARQIDLANRIWNMDTTEEIMAFFDTLPQRARIDAYVVYSMILWAWQDQEPVGDCQQARAVIDHVRSL